MDKVEYKDCVATNVANFRRTAVTMKQERRAYSGPRSFEGENMLRIVLIVLVAVVPCNSYADELASELRAQEERADRMEKKMDDLEKRVRRLEQPNIPTIPSNQLPGRLVPHPSAQELFGSPMGRLNRPQKPSSAPSLFLQEQPVPKHWQHFWFNGQRVFVVPLGYTPKE